MRIFHRLCGLEQEYGVNLERFTPDLQVVADLDCEPLVKRLVGATCTTKQGSSKGFLGATGGRMYYDTNASSDVQEECRYGHLEYATPECYGPLEVTQWHFGGDVLLHQLASQMEGGLEQINIYRDNTDGQRSYGCHENYLVSKAISWEQWADILLPYLSTSPVLFGAGYLESDGNYRFDSRSKEIYYETTTGTLGKNRALINQREEPLVAKCYQDRYRRMHLICRDSNTQWATYMKVATLLILLAMGERGQNFADLRPLHPVKAVRAVSENVWKHPQIEMVGGKRLTAVEIQKEILQRAERFVGNLQANFPGEVPEWVESALAWWGQALYDLANYSPDDWPLSSYWIDWWVKWHQIQMYKEKVPTADLGHLQAVALRYHHIHPARSGAREMTDLGLLKYLFSDDELLYAAQHPSSHRRAQERAEWVKKAATDRTITAIDWTSATIGHTVWSFDFL